MAQSTDTTKYVFNRYQVKELLKSAYELEKCEKNLNDLNLLVDTAQMTIHILSNVIHDKNRYIYKQRNKLKLWRNTTITISLASILYFISNVK